MTQIIRRTILIVDDAESICTVLGRMLNVHGYDTLICYDGQQGLQAAREHQPDIILLDLMMPVLDGWGTIGALKADPSTAAIPVIAMTALTLSEQRLLDAGFTGYLSKPITTHRLREEIRRASALRA